jgi:hypothetical protein
MKHRWAALVLVLALGALAPVRAVAQTRTPTSSRDSGAGFELGQNYPNPFNPSTTIPFTLGDPPACSDGRQHKVSLHVYNVLAQLVAIPVLRTGEGAESQPVENLTLRCGSYTALWNGTFLNRARALASGVYLYRLEVDGRVLVKKMIVMVDRL